MRRMACRGTGTHRRLLGMALYMECKSERSWTPCRAVVDVAKVSFVLDQVSRPTASRRRMEARRCSPPIPPTSLCSSFSVYPYNTGFNAFLAMIKLQYLHKYLIFL